jgi:hypothetical protein
VGASLRPVGLLALVVVVVVAAGGAVALTRGSDGDGAPPPVVAGTPEIRRLMSARLRERHLSFRYVACVRSGRAFEGVPVVRCNVNFNAPHIEVYCAVVRGGALVTDHEDATIACPRDTAGDDTDPPVKVSGG